MVFTNAGKNRVRDLLDTDMSYGMVGTSGVAASVSDTSLGSAITATSSAVTTTVADKQVIADFILPATSANGSTLQEFGLFSTNDTLFARQVFTSLLKTSTEEIQFSTKVNII